MKLIFLISLTFIHHAKALSYDFVATEQPSGLRSYRDSRVQTVCDQTRECNRLNTRSRSQCQRWNCCWVSNKCVAKTYYIVDLYSGTLIGNCRYRFTKQGPWDETREECKSYGGDLIHKNLGQAGAAYHDKLREFIASEKDLLIYAIWIGHTDLEKEGEWKLLNGELWDPNDKAKASLYYWYSTEPNNVGGEHCGQIRLFNPGEDVVLNDNVCTKFVDTKRKFIGLCEIC